MDDNTGGFGEIRPFEVSTEFEMGMYPPPGYNTGPHPGGMEFNHPEQPVQVPPHLKGHINNTHESVTHERGSGSGGRTKNPVVENARNDQLHHHHPNNSKNGNRNI